MLSLYRVCQVAQPEFSEHIFMTNQRTTLSPILVMVLNVSKGLFTAVPAHQKTDESFDWGLLVWRGRLG